MKIIFFPFAGGNMYSYANFKELLPKVIHTKVLEYPGRGSRVEEPLLDDINLIVADILSRLMKEIDDSDYIIYGHSMGALVGYLLCHKIEQMKIKKPTKLVVSGRAAPSIEKDEKINGLPKEMFWAKVIELGGVPKEILNEPLMLDFFEPLLRSDFKAVEDYEHKIKSNLSIPIDVLYGRDEIDDLNKVDQWKKESREKVKFYSLEGGHFFIHTNPIFFKSYFNDLLLNGKILRL